MTVFRDFYATLLRGSPALQDSLAQAMRDRPRNDNPYDLLSSHLDNAFDAAALAISKDGESEKWADTLYYNGRFGVRLSINVLRTIGDIYADRAPTPQRPLGVAYSIGRGLSHIHSLAFTGRDGASINAAACMLGVDPSDPNSKSAIDTKLFDFFVNRIGLNETVSPHTFSAEVRPDGQLDVRPRYPLLIPPTARPCPGALVQTLESRPRTELRRLLHILGKVTLQEIYPRSFGIQAV